MNHSKLWKLFDDLDSIDAADVSRRQTSWAQQHNRDGGGAACAAKPVGQPLVVTGQGDFRRTWPVGNG